VASVEVDAQRGKEIVEAARRYVLYSWSVQDAISPIAVAGGEGRYFWDYEGKRYLDFASQLVNLALGHEHPSSSRRSRSRPSSCARSVRRWRANRARGWGSCWPR
jgi:taurine---2-oxoglutarate transaminase